MRRDADFVDKPLQDIELSRLPILVTCGDCPRNHTELNRVFLPVTHRGGPKGPGKSLDNPAFFHGGTHPGFQRDCRSYYLGEDHSLGKTWYVGEAREARR